MRGEEVEVEAVAPCLRMGWDRMGKGLGGMRGGGWGVRVVGARVCARVWGRGGGHGLAGLCVLGGGGDKVMVVWGLGYVGQLARGYVRAGGAWVPNVVVVPCSRRRRPCGP